MLLMRIIKVIEVEMVVKVIEEGITNQEEEEVPKIKNRSYVDS